MPLLTALGAIMAFLVEHSFAQRTLPVNTLGITISSLTGRIVYIMAVYISALCAVLFIIGALMITASRGKDDMIQRGRDLMIGGLIGTALVLGAAAIARMFIAFLYA
jgi:hypothetical protein